MKKILRTILLASALLTLPSVVVAASVPPNVTGVTAAVINGALTVQWQPVKDSSVSKYRIYYSRASILGNQGDFDDFVETLTSEPSFTFPSVPYKGSTLYISVMAVNAQGNESEAFESEASVKTELPASNGGPSSSVSSETRTALPVETATVMSSPVASASSSTMPVYIPTPSTPQPPTPTMEIDVAPPQKELTTSLSETGIGLLGLMLVSGGIAGARVRKHSKVTP